MKTTGLQKVSEALDADDQHRGPHCAYFVRRWHRIAQAIFEWLVVGKEQPLGPLRHRFVRAEFQPDRGGLQHYHALLETLLEVSSDDPQIRTEALKRLRECVTRDLRPALEELGVEKSAIDEVMILAETVLVHGHNEK